MTTHNPAPRPGSANAALPHIDSARAAKSAARNDALRRERLGGYVMMTAAVATVPPDTLTAAILAMRRFDAFSTKNDPYGEHDFGAFEHADERFFIKIDTYADASLTWGAEDPLAPGVVRVLTLMLASDY